MIKGCLASCCEAHTEPAACRLTSNTSTAPTDPCPKHSHAPNPPHCVSEAEQGPLVHHPQQYLGCRTTIHYLCISFLRRQVRQIVFPKVAYRQHHQRSSWSRTICLHSSTKPQRRHARSYSWRLWLGLRSSWRCQILLTWPSSACTGH